MILYELLSGAAPFRAPDTRRLEQQIRGGYHRHPLPATVPAGLRAVTARLLAPSCDDRYESATALREDLEAFAAQRPTTAERLGFLAPADDAATRRTRPAASDDATRRTRPDPGAPIPVADPVKSVTAIPPARARRLPTLRGALLLAAFLVVGNEALLGVSARRLAFAASVRDLDGITPLWDDYGRLSGRSLLRVGIAGLETSLRARVLDLSERVIANYRSPLPTVRERQWRAAQVNLQQALILAPDNKRLKADLRYCEGHLHRIDGEAAKSRNQRASASQHFAEAVSAFREAAELRPDWPDPFLGLARTFIYGLEDTDRAADAMQQAQKRGYGIGDRDTAQFGDGYRARGDSLRQTARQLMHLPQETEYLQRALVAYRAALAQYERIPEFPGVAATLRRVHWVIEELEKRLSDLAAEKSLAAEKERSAPWE